VVGRLRDIYEACIDTVNTDNRMESSETAGRIQVTEEMYRRLTLTHTFERRGQIEIKGKGPMTTYFLIGRQSNGVPSGVVDSSRTGDTPAGGGASSIVPD